MKDTNRRYEGSEEFWGTAGVAIVFTIVGFISVAFILLKIDFIGLRFWGFWMFIPAFFLWISTISTYISNKRLKKTVEGAVSVYKEKGGRVSLSDLCAETMISQKDILKVLMDLRTEGRIKYIYDRNNGDILFGDSYKEEELKTEKEIKKEPEPEIAYCPYCGTKVLKSDKFCYKCGSSFI
ncbi:MAG: zinc ribbon domain-containing protein [Candidatus Helarchaeota archaeon]